MSQLENLQDNIDELTEVILSLNEDSKPFDIGKYFLTPRQIAKKMMIDASPIITDSSGAVTPVDEKSVHIVVYGKYMMGTDGKVIDNEVSHPECVDLDRAMSITHPTLKDKIPNLKKEVKNSLRMLKIKEKKLKDATVLAGKQIITGISAFAAGATTLPLGSGVPTALSALQSIVATINNLSVSVLEIIPLLSPLIDIPLLVAEASLDIVLIVINTILMAIIAVLSLIDGIKKLLGPIIKLV